MVIKIANSVRTGINYTTKIYIQMMGTARKTITFVNRYS